MSIHPSEAERFISDLQDHIEDVASFYVSQDELVEVVRRLAEEGHRELPTFERANHTDGSAT
jgi:hypothetical protein